MNRSLVNHIIVIGIICLIMIASSVAHAQEILRIGLTLGLSGEYAELADMQLKGYQLWEKDVNAKGGILGNKVQIIIRDDNSDPQTAKTLYSQMIEEEKVDFVFGPYSSAITEAILPITEKNSYPVIAAGAAADSIWEKGYNYVFGMFVPSSKLSTSFLELLAFHKITSIAILQADDPFSRNNARGIMKWAKRLGIRVLMHEEIPMESNSLDVVALRAKKSGAEALIISARLEQTIRLNSALKNINWTPRALYTPVGPGLPYFIEKLGRDAEQVFSSSQWGVIANINHPGSREFYETFLNTYKKRPSHFAATAYAAGQVLEAAITKAHTTNRKKVRDMLSRLDVMTISGRYGVDRTGLQVKKFTIVTQIQNGNNVVVWPSKMSTAQPIFR